MLLHKTMHKFAVVFATVLLAGCGVVKDAYMVDSLTVDRNSEPLELGSTQFVQNPFDIDTGRLPSSANEEQQTSGGPSAYEDAKGDASGVKRNDLMDHLIKNSGNICEAHKAGIISTASAANLGLTEVSTVLSGLGAILTPASTVRALSGAATITSATNANISQAAYQSLVAEAIVASIEQAREEKDSHLSLNRKKSLTDYSVDQMLVDVDDYHHACSFYQGLVTLTKAVDRISPTSAELQARIDALMAQYKKNMTTLGEASKSPGVTSNLDAANATIMASVAQLQSQLASTPATSK